MLRRGFKAEATRVAGDLRRELGMTQLSRFDPFGAADYLGIPLYEFSALISDGRSPQAVLLRDGRVSAMTVFVSKHRRAIFYDAARASTRVVSDLSHELSHALLFHPPHSVLVEGGCGGISVDAEEEAAHLSGVLLVSDEAALNVVSRDLSIESGAAMYGISEKMMRWRINISGAHVRMRRRKALLS